MTDLNWNMLDDSERKLLSEMFDTQEAHAEFLDTAAEQLRNGDNPHRIAHYLSQVAGEIRAARARTMERIGGNIAPDRPTDDPRYQRGAH